MFLMFVTPRNVVDRYQHLAKCILPPFSGPSLFHRYFSINLPYCTLPCRKTAMFFPVYNCLYTLLAPHKTRNFITYTLRQMQLQ
jgi:hypothetical protein